MTLRNHDNINFVPEEKVVSIKSTCLKMASFNATLYKIYLCFAAIGFIIGYINANLILMIASSISLIMGELQAIKSIIYTLEAIRRR